MRLPIPCNRVFTQGLLLVCAVFINGCSKNQSNPPPTAAPTTAASAAAASAPANPPNARNMSSVPVKGDEQLPPNHPAISSMNPPHAGAIADDKAGPGNQIASQHPKPEGKKQLAVVIPDSVKGKWSAANIAVTVNGTEKEIKATIGNKIALGNNLELRIVHYLPAYTSDFKTVTSTSDKQTNPAIMIQAIASGKVVAEGWVFQNLPDFNSFNSEQVKVHLISAEQKK